MTTKEIAELVQEALEVSELVTENEIRVRTFEEVGMLCGNAGLVLSIDGEEFQMQIVRSR